MTRESGATERAAEGGPEPEATGSSIAAKTPLAVFLVGLSWCILSGFLSPCANLGFDWADKIRDQLVAMGTDERLGSLGQWLPMWWGGYLAMLIVFVSQLVRKGTWKNFSGPGAGRDAGLAVMMGCLHFLAQFPYGVGAVYLGKLGTTVGWVVSIASSLIVANLLGFVTGEWKKAPRSSINTLYLGLAILIVAMVILAYGNSLAQ